MLFKDDEGKTEKPTPDRLLKARNKGQTSISKEFTMAASLLVAVLTLELLGGGLIGSFEELLKWGMTVDLAEHPLDPDNNLAVMEELSHVASIILPTFLTLVGIFFLATLLAGYSQIGIRMAKEAIGLKLNKLNPVTNLGRVFQLTSVFKTVFSAFKLAIIGSVLYFVLQDEWEQILSMHQVARFEDNVEYIAALALRVFFWIALIVLVIAIADIAWNRYRHTKSLMMTKQEVEDERKRTDGDPLIKSRLKGARLALMRQRMMESIPKADVVITNPTHYSVALKYDRQKNMAPQVVAKGLDDMAMRIRELARKHDVPLMEDPPLARALHRAVDVGQEIPERFFKAVAAVLGHVYRLKESVA
jgi:flagellar biosynthetic protein FlhB